MLSNTNYKLDGRTLDFLEQRNQINRKESHIENILRVLGLDETELGIFFCLIMFSFLFMPRREEPIVEPTEDGENWRITWCRLPTISRICRVAKTREKKVTTQDDDDTCLKTLTLIILPRMSDMWHMRLSKGSIDEFWFA